MTRAHGFQLVQVGGVLLSAAALAWGGRSPGTPLARARLAPSQTAASPSPVFEPDKGRFRILVNGQQVGREQYEMVAQNGDWIARGSSDIQSAQGTTHVAGTLEIRPDGTPVRYEWSTEGSKKASAVVTFNNTAAVIELRLGNARPYTQQFSFPSSRIAVLDDNMNYQYAVLARLYDWDKKGVQTFSVLVPQELTPGTATIESLGKQESSGRKLDELRVKTVDNEIDLFLDGTRLVRLSVPSANAEIIRE
jgi:hypothetical protein